MYWRYDTDQRESVRFLSFFIAKAKRTNFRFDEQTIPQESDRPGRNFHGRTKMPPAQTKMKDRIFNYYYFISALMQPNVFFFFPVPVAMSAYDYVGRVASLCAISLKA